MIKDVIVEANRYEDVINALKKILSMDNNNEYPCKAYIDEDGITRWHVNIRYVKSEAKDLIYRLESSSKDSFNGTSSDDYFNLNAFVRSESDIMLHNYAISVSHRRSSIEDLSELDASMDKCRILLIIGNLIDQNFDDDYYIPDGWKRLPED